MQIERYLDKLEKMGDIRNVDDYYLWPRTEIQDGTMQNKIERICGAKDSESQNPSSRSYEVIAAISELIGQKELRKDFNLLDITCGDGVVLLKLKERFPDMSAYGIDCLKDVFVTHSLCYEGGVKIYRGFLQDIFNKANIDDEVPIFDCVIMLNTYRGWESADLREDEQDIPQMADLFFSEKAKYTIITATNDQIDRLKKNGFGVRDIGKGESSNSRMILISKICKDIVVGND